MHFLIYSSTRSEISENQKGARGVPQDQSARSDSPRIYRPSAFLHTHRHAHLNWQHCQREREELRESTYADFVALLGERPSTLAAFQLKFHLVLKTKLGEGQRTGRARGRGNSNREQNKSINLYDFLMCFIRRQMAIYHIICSRANNGIAFRNFAKNPI